MLIELPTDTPEVLFTKILVDPTPTVDVILVPKIFTFESYRRGEIVANPTNNAVD
jgi:hypothetical protein